MRVGKQHACVLVYTKLAAAADNHAYTAVYDQVQQQYSMAAADRAELCSACCHAPAYAEVSCTVVIRKVAISGHPDISSNKYADGIVCLPCLKVVVEQK